MRLSSIALFATVLSFVPQIGLAERLQIVTSIRPINSLVEYVAGDHADITVLVPANASPHNYALKPSEAQHLQNADVIFWVDEHLESFLEKALETIPQNAEIITLAEQAGISVLPAREIDLMHEAKEQHEDASHQETAHDQHELHEHGAHDLHIWLDPANAKTMASIIAQTLGRHDPDHQAQFEENASKLIAELDELIVQTQKILTQVNDQKFVTFHDAYQYFENRFSLQNAGVVTVSPQIKPGAKRLTGLRAALAANNIQCVFSEPQFDANLVQLAIEGTNVRTAELDPLGTNLENGPELYFNLIKQMRSNIVDCLKN